MGDSGIARLPDPASTVWKAARKAEPSSKTSRTRAGTPRGSPLGVKLDADEWILFMAGHRERHLQQIRYAETGPNLPGSPTARAGAGPGLGLVFPEQLETQD
jgi:hypothetical protein